MPNHKVAGSECKGEHRGWVEQLIHIPTQLTLTVSVCYVAAV